MEDLPEGQEESLNSGTLKLCLVGFTASPAAVNLEITAGITGLWPYFIVLLSTRITVGSWKNLSLLRGLCRIEVFMNDVMANNRTYKSIFRNISLYLTLGIR